jgi:membrane protein
MGTIWLLIKGSVLGFLDDDALSRGAAISYYTVTSLAPILIIVILIAGIFFGGDAARGAIQDELGGLIGKEGAAVLQDIITNASSPSASTAAGLVGVAKLVITASGAFGEIQSALNAIWRARPEGATLTRLVRARLVSLGLVATLGFLLLVSLVVSTAVTGLTRTLNATLPFGGIIARALSLSVSFLLIALMFGAIYKALPDRTLRWRDVVVGAAATSALLTVGKSLIGLYLGSSYGAAGGLIVLFVWVYYTAQIFLLGAEFTKVYASNFGSMRGTAATDSVAKAAGDEP